MGRPRRVSSWTVLKDLIGQATDHDLSDLVAELRSTLGSFLLRRGELAARREQFEQAEALLADQPLTARVLAIRGRATAHYLEGDVRYSCYLLESTINELNGGGLPGPASLMLLYAAVIGPYLELGALERATKAASLAPDLAPRVSDPIAIAAPLRGAHDGCRPPVRGGRSRTGEGLRGVSAVGDPRRAGAVPLDAWLFARPADLTGSAWHDHPRTGAAAAAGHPAGAGDATHRVTGRTSPCQVATAVMTKSPTQEPVAVRVSQLFSSSCSPDFFDTLPLWVPIAAHEDLGDRVVVLLCGQLFAAGKGPGSACSR